MSDQYIVSARKYRPQTFDTVVGQEHITTTLKNAMRNDHLAHAFLFCGPRGVGKTTCARILARTLNCEQPTAEMEACGHCPTCTSFNNNTSFNVFELDAASNNSVDDIRALTEQVRFAPQQGKYKVYIIDEVHMLSSAAFNAFLKTLEEPPSYAIFILATTEKHKILPTILSRCQIFDFKRITTNDTVQHLQTITAREHMEAEEAALHIIAQKSEGCMRDALSMLDRIASFTNGRLTYNATMEHLNQLDADFYFRITDTILAQDVAGTLLLLDAVLEKGFEGDTIINGFAEHFRNLLLCKDARMAKLLDVPNNHKPVYHEKAGQTPPSFLLSALNVVNDSELSYKNATNRRLHTELCLIRLCYLLQATSATTAAAEKKNHSSELSVTPVAGNPVPVQPLPSQAEPETSVPVMILDQARPTPPLPSSPTPETVKTTDPVQAAAPVPGSTNPFARTDNTVRRISKNMMLEVPAVQQQQKMEMKDLGQQQLDELMDQYREKIKGENKHTQHAQFLLIRAGLVEEGMINLLSPTSITDMYAQTHRTEFQEFIKEATGLLLRITTSFTETEPEHKEKTLTRTEIFQEMATKNPSLLYLRDAMKMSLEY